MAAEEEAGEEEEGERGDADRAESHDDAQYEYLKSVFESKRRPRGFVRGRGMGVVPRVEERMRKRP